MTSKVDTTAGNTARMAAGRRCITGLLLRQAMKKKPGRRRTAYFCQRVWSFGDPSVFRASNDASDDLIANLGRRAQASRFGDRSDDADDV